jgi:Tol biopolymer transport system component
LRQGARFKSADFNFWGVTFAAADSNMFYATLRTGKMNYLVRGNIARRTTTVIAEDVECPSLSPNGRLIAFKRRVNPTPNAWRLYVMDLSTMTDRPIAAVGTYVDDQVEWLDSNHILFALPHLGTADVWVAAIDGSEPSRMLMHDADSPIVVRPPLRTNTDTSATR